MAREIHDTLAQGFTGIVLQLEAAIHSIGNNEDRLREYLDNARLQARESLNEARRSVWALRPKTLEQLPLEDALIEEIEKLKRETAIKTSITISNNKEPLSHDVETALLRITQEAITNIKKHSQATEVMVTLQYEHEHIKLSIRDNGSGFTPSKITAGSFGLIGMRERARLLSGNLYLQSEKHKGTLIQVIIPVN